MQRSTRALFLSSVILTLTACVGDVTRDNSASPESSDNLGSATIQLLSVPSAVRCVSVTVTSSDSSQAQSFAVVGGTTVALNLGRLPLGAANFDGLAYDVACASIASATPTWIADPVSTELRPGVASSIELAFRKNNPVQATGTFVDNIVRITSGNAGTLALTAEGTAYCWGSVPGLCNSASEPVLVTSLPAAKTVSFFDGWGHACLVTPGGDLRCWGSNAYGQLGTGSVGGSVAAPGNIVLRNVKDVAVGEYHTCAVLLSSEVRCFGRNNYGQLGNGTTTNSATPVSLPGITQGISRIFSGMNHSCAQTGRGWTYCWGRNDAGQLGLNDTTDRSSATTIAGGETGMVSLSLGARHSCAVRSDGTLRCWGYNAFGQVGDGTTTQRLVPTNVALPAADPAVAVVAGGYHTCAALASGAVRCWGYSAYGQVGDRGTTSRTTPVAAVGLEGIDQISAGANGYTTCALDLDTQQAWCWGSGSETGTGTTDTRYQPTQVSF